MEDPSFKMGKLTLKSGFKMPILGLGTWKSKPGEVCRAVQDALDMGYRHLDCAQIYGNEKEVGAGIMGKIRDGIVKREDLFVTSKLWNTFHRPDLVERALKKTLNDLQLDYLDLYLMHWPIAYKEEGDLFPKNSDGKIEFSSIDYLDTWRAMESACAQGLVRSIGLSNFNKRQIQRILDNAKIHPSSLQVECHPYLNQTALIEFCRKNDIIVTGYSPLGSPDRPWAQPGEPNLLQDSRLTKIADKHRKSPAQILIRYQIERGVATIPKSVTQTRIRENFHVFDFKLDPEDQLVLDGFNCGGRFVPMSAALGHPHHPFENDEY